MDPKQEARIRDLYQTLRSKRAVAKRLRIDVKTVRAVLGQTPCPEAAPPPTTSKLAPFLPLVAAKAKEGLSASRILREIRALGYTGGRTLVVEAVRPLRGPRTRGRKAFRRFETPPGEEAQVDWSPVRVTIAGREQVVHCFAMVLHWSRAIFTRFYRDERLPTLLSAHVAAFEFFEGIARRIVYDNMATVVLGRIEKRPLWNERFLAFSKHFAFEPFVCRPRDPNRKGGVESAIGYIQRDVALGEEFESLDHLNRHAEHWLRTVANVRVHGTTKEVPQERLKREKPLLTPLPTQTFPTWASEVRKVQNDCLISLGGNLYSVPPLLVGREVRLRVYPERLEVVDGLGTLLASHRIAEGKGKRVIDPAHYEAIRRPSGESKSETERRFLTMFPNATAFLAGVKRRMKGLAIVHLRILARLAVAYGVERDAEVLAFATSQRNWSASSVTRILAHRYGEAVEGPELPLLGPAADAARAAGGVEERRLSDLLKGGSDEEGA
ncbi:IS21 family transposase [bacterium]|nr:IS21 family transposase [bacterium]